MHPIYSFVLVMLHSLSFQTWKEIKIETLLFAIICHFEDKRIHVLVQYSCSYSDLAWTLFTSSFRTHGRFSNFLLLFYEHQCTPDFQEEKFQKRALTDLKTLSFYNTFCEEESRRNPLA